MNKSHKQRLMKFCNRNANRNCNHANGVKTHTEAKNDNVNVTEFENLDITTIAEAINALTLLDMRKLVKLITTKHINTLKFICGVEQNLRNSH